MPLTSFPFRKWELVKRRKPRAGFEIGHSPPTARSIWGISFGGSPVGYQMIDRDIDSNIFNLSLRLPDYAIILDFGIDTIRSIDIW